MTTHIDMGAAAGAARAELDLEELLATRLLVQGNSGSGKSHLLRRLLEAERRLVQQVVIDPEGDFVTLAEEFGHLVIEAADYTERESPHRRAHPPASRLGRPQSRRARGRGADALRRAFLNGLFDAPRDHWFPALVVVDEAQLFAPAVAGDVGEKRRAYRSAR
jgi:DNA helicase HerA-like ATPase